jgi:hypothetical protein
MLAATFSVARSRSAGAWDYCIQLSGIVVGDELSIHLIFHLFHPCLLHFMSSQSFNYFIVSFILYFK